APFLADETPGGDRLFLAVEDEELAGRLVRDDRHGEELITRGHAGQHNSRVAGRVDAAQGWRGRGGGRRPAGGVIGRRGIRVQPNPGRVRTGERVDVHQDLEYVARRDLEHAERRGSRAD